MVHGELAKAENAAAGPGIIPRQRQRLGTTRRVNACGVQRRDRISTQRAQAVRKLLAALIERGVDDLAVYRKKIVDAGGKIMVDDQEVPGMGHLCLFTDPEGRMLGLWKGNSDGKSS